MNMTAVGIVAIICWAIVELFGSRKKNKADNAQLNKDKADLEQQIAMLKERVEVLEKIVTDDKYDLKKQFDDLDKAS